VKKFLMLMYGASEPTPEGMAAWRAWFERIGDHIVDSGNPLGACVEVTPAGTRSVGPDEGASVGYTIISADSLEEAVRLLDDCPIVDSVRLHEALPM
jgi:hypothetical protein